MSLLKGKKGLIMGVANDRSIAWGIAKKFPIVKNTEKEVNLNAVMSNSFGFGGTNAALIFEKV